MSNVVARLEVAPGTAQVAGHRVEVSRSSRGVLRYFLGGVRVDRAALLTLLCDRHDCANRQRAVERFQAFTEAAPQPAAPQPHPRPWPVIRCLAGAGAGASEPPGAALMRPVMLDDEIELRPATYPCRVVCPMNAHPSAVQAMSGYDAFHRGQYLAGGTVARGAETRPLIATVLDARRVLRDVLRRAG